MKAQRLCVAATCAAVAVTAFWPRQALYALDSGIASFAWLGTLPGDTSSGVSAVSDDGSTVVGTSSSRSDVLRAFRWTRDGGIQAIGDLPGGEVRSQASGVSGDGLVIAGLSSSSLSFSHHPAYSEPFVWSEAEGIQGLGFLPGTNGRYGAARAVSGNGQVVVGTSTGDNGTRPFRWSATTGMLDLGDLDSERGFRIRPSQSTATARSSSD